VTFQHAVGDHPMQWIFLSIAKGFYSSFTKRHNPNHLKSKASLFLFSLIALSHAVAQPRGVTKLCRQINDLVDQQNQTSPLADYVELAPYKLKAEDLGSGEELEDRFFFNASKDSARASLVIDHLNSQIDVLLERLLRIPGVFNHDLDSLLSNLSVSHSANRKLWSVGYFANGGGTYRSYDSQMLYVHSKDSIQRNFDYEFGPDGYYRIEQLEHDGETAYLLFSWVRGCSYCFAESVELILPSEDDFKPLFRYDISSRFWNNKIEFDTADSVLHINYGFDDLNEGCMCDRESEYPYGVSDENEEYSEHTCYFWYKYDGHNFRLIASEMKIGRLEE